MKTELESRRPLRSANASGQAGVSVKQVQLGQTNHTAATAHAQAGGAPVFAVPGGRPMSRAVLALDLGTTTGWALTGTDGLVSSGSESFKPGRFDGGGMRFLRFKRWLTELKGDGGFEAVYFEEVRRHAGVDAAHAYGGFMAVLMAWCEHHSIPYQGVPVGTIKRSFTGKGNADKEAMKAEAVRRGFAVADDNEADALAILLWAQDAFAGSER